MSAADTTIKVAKYVSVPLGVMVAFTFGALALRPVLADDSSKTPAPATTVSVTVTDTPTAAPPAPPAASAAAAAETPAAEETPVTEPTTPAYVPPAPARTEEQQQPVSEPTDEAPAPVTTIGPGGNVVPIPKPGLPPEYGPNTQPIPGGVLVTEGADS